MIDEARKIADALRLCNQNGDCSNCAFRKEKFDCVERLHYAAANLIERLSAELETVNGRVDVLVAKAVNFDTLIEAASKVQAELEQVKRELGRDEQHGE